MRLGCENGICSEKFAIVVGNVWYRCAGNFVNESKMESPKNKTASSGHEVNISISPHTSIGINANVHVHVCDVLDVELTSGDTVTVCKQNNHIAKSAAVDGFRGPAYNKRWV